MRIGFDVSKVATPRDGIGTYCAQLLGAMAESSEEHTFRAHVLVEPADPASLEVALANFPGCVELARVPPSEDGLDVFHATTLAWPRDFDGPVVMTCYDLTFLTHPQHHTLLNRLHCIEGMVRGAVGEAHVLAISQATADAVSEHIGVPQDRLHVVHCAPGETAPGECVLDDRSVGARGTGRGTQADGDSGPAQLGPDVFGQHDLVPDDLVPQGPYVLAVGTLEPRKNLRRLIEAHAQLPLELRQAFPLVVVGSGGWKNERLLDCLQTAEHVHLAGSADTQQLTKLYRGASVFVYPSLAEGFGLPILEAMACGTPVITSNVTSMPEVAGDAALLIDPEDSAAIAGALERVLTDEALAAELSERGKRRVAEFSWHKAAAETLDVYRAAIDSASKP